MSPESESSLTASAEIPPLPIPLRDNLLDRLAWLTDHDLALVVATVEDAIDEGYWEVRYVGPD